MDKAPSNLSLQRNPTTALQNSLSSNIRQRSHVKFSVSSESPNFYQSFSIGVFLSSKKDFIMHALGKCTGLLLIMLMLLSSICSVTEKGKAVSRIVISNGKFITKANGKNKKWTIDSFGQFHKGPAFKDYHEMKKLIAARENDFARGFSESLIAYALGRSYAFTDDDMTEELLAEAKKQNYTLNSIIHGLVQRKEFRHK
jgi:hypothetical protein